MNETLQHTKKLATHLECLLQKIQQKTIRVGVIGLGYVGLPFALEKAKVGLRVTGIEQNRCRMEQIQAGQSYIDDVSSAQLQHACQNGTLNVTDSYDKVAHLDVIIICVPTPLDKNQCPNLSHVTQVAHSLVPHLRAGQLICLESTTYPGTTEELIGPILEKSGLKLEQELFLAHSPERVDPGNQRYTTHNTNKVVGGIGPNSLSVAMAFYQLAIQHVIPVSSAKAAELVKVYENTYRAVNIALANELTMLCDRMQLDVWEVLDAAFTKPFGIMPFYPGPGVGGHCIPIDPHYLEWKAKEYHFQTRFITLAGEINQRMPLFVFNKAARLLNNIERSMKNAHIFLVGMTYKKDVRDYRESPALDVYRLLHSAGAHLSYHDPLVSELEIDGAQLSSTPLSPASLRQADLVMILTNHSHVDYALLQRYAHRILDTRNVYGNKTYANVTKL